MNVIHKARLCLITFPSVSRGVFNTRLRANPAKYRTNFPERNIDAIASEILLSLLFVQEKRKELHGSRGPYGTQRNKI